MRVYLLSLLMAVSTFTSADAFTRWFEDKRDTRPVEVWTDFEVPTAQAPVEPLTTLEVDHQKEAYHCLAMNIYWEARNQSHPGMIAVARVVMNRVRDGRFPDNVCDVVYEGPVKESWKTKQDPDLPDEERIYYPRRDRCQFSWYCDGRSDQIPKQDIDYAWRKAQEIAFDILYEDRYRGVVQGATHYHADYVKPDWRRELTYIARVDDHLFYRWD